MFELIQLAWSWPDLFWWFPSGYRNHQKRSGQLQAS